MIGEPRESGVQPEDPQSQKIARLLQEKAEPLEAVLGFAPRIDLADETRSATIDLATVSPGQVENLVALFKGRDILKGNFFLMVPFDDLIEVLEELSPVN